MSREVLKIYAEPAIEPVSLQDIKSHLRLDSGSIDDNLSPSQSIAPGSHAVTVGYALIGSYVDVLGYSAEVIFDSGTNQATGTVDIKIQESDDHSTWTDWAGGAFTQVTTANDNAIYKKSYTGSKQYIRVVGKVLLAACEFGVSIVRYASDTTEDTLLSTLITAARKEVEKITHRALITQTWDLWLDEFPSESFIKVPKGKLQSITSFAYTDSGGTTTTMTATTDYLVDTNSDPGRIVLPYGVSWPSPILYPMNPIAIRFVCGYGLTAADVEAGLRTAIKMMVEDMYNSRDAKTILPIAQTITENKTVMNLLIPYTLWEF